MISTDNSTLLRRRLKPALLTLLAVAGVAFAARNLILGTPVETYEAARSDLIQTVVASGRIIELVDGRIVSDKPNVNVLRRG